MPELLRMDRVEFTAACPVCGSDATWIQRQPVTDGATAGWDDILCRRCEFSFTAQRRSVLERSPLEQVRAWQSYYRQETA